MLRRAAGHALMAAPPRAAPPAPPASPDPQELPESPGSPGPPGPGRRAVLLADAQRTFAEALAARLRTEDRFTSVHAVSDPAEAVALLGARQYDVVLLDPAPDPAAWAPALQALAARDRRPAVVVVSDERRAERVVDVLTLLEVRGWVSKDASYDELLGVLDLAGEGLTSIAPAVLGPVLHELLLRAAGAQRAPSFVDELTPRQREVLRCLAAGTTRAEVAEQLGLSPNTVRTHVQEVLRKAGVHSTLAAVARAREVGYP